MLILHNLAGPVLRASETENTANGMEGKEFTGIWSARKKSGRETAAFGKNPHSYLESSVPDDVRRIKEFLDGGLASGLRVKQGLRPGWDMA